MCATSANLVERVLPPRTALRQWVLTFPFAWRRRLAADGALLRRLDRIFVDTVQRFYASRAAEEGAAEARTGSVTVAQRTSSDLRLNPHTHTVVLDGTWYESGGELIWQGLSHLRTREVGDVLWQAVDRITRYLRRHELLLDEEDEPEDPEAGLLASAVSGEAPPTGPQWRRGLPVLDRRALAYDKPLCATLDGFSLHAATRAGGHDPEGREALLRYVLRPPVSNERLELLPDGLVRVRLKKAFADGRWRWTWTRCRWSPVWPPA